MVAGAAETKGRKWHAFLHDGTRMIDLGALLPEGESFATGINNAGQVVGTVQAEDERLTFVWRDGKMIVYRGGQGLHLVNRINDAGQVIGAIRGTRMEAAVLSASAMPQEPPGVMRPLMTALAGALLAAGIVIVWRRRYRGLSWRSLGAKRR
jgi:probable HAF family extracellular repeat protein